MQDRTSEFFSAATTITSRSSSSAAFIVQNKPKLTKTEFAKAAMTIGKELNATMIKLQKLATLAKNKSLFDDKPIEINELIFLIKQDIAKIHRQITTLNQYVQQNKGKGELDNKQIAEHSTQVLFSLQSKLATTSNEFQNVLEVRNSNMKEQKSRREEYSTSARIQEIDSSQTYSDSPLYFPDKKSATITQNMASSSSTESLTNRQNRNLTSSNMTQDTVIDFGDASNDTFGFQQNMMATNYTNMQVIESRAQAIESIESTIAELGQIYQHFAQLLSTQREVVQRIDDNIVDTEVNVIGAHDQLLKFYQNMSSNRWLMMKVFATVIFFTLIFVMFLH